MHHRRLSAVRGGGVIAGMAGSIDQSGRPPRLLPLGDSITQGSPDHPGGYRGMLERLLREGGFPGVEFVGSRAENSDGLAQPWHEGHPGFRLEELRGGFTKCGSTARPIGETLARYRPDVVLLVAGTNNMYLDEPAAVWAEMAALLGAIRPVPVIVGTLLPIEPGPKPWGIVIPPDIGERIAAYNALLRREGPSAGAVEVVDLSHCVASRADLLADGVHPGAAAQDRIAVALAGALRACSFTGRN